MDSLQYIEPWSCWFLPSTWYESRLRSWYRSSSAIYNCQDGSGRVAFPPSRRLARISKGTCYDRYILS